MGVFSKTHVYATSYKGFTFATKTKELAASDIFMKPINWGLTAFVWIYAVVWMFINNAVKEYVGKRVREDV